MNQIINYYSSVSVPGGFVVGVLSVSTGLLFLLNYFITLQPVLLRVMLTCK